MSVRSLIAAFVFLLSFSALNAQPLSPESIPQTIDSIYLSGDYLSGIAYIQRALSTSLPDSLSAYCHYRLGICELELAKYDDAETEFLKAKDLFSAAFSPVHPAVSSIWSRLAVIYREEARIGDAIDAATNQFQNYKATLGEKDRYTALSAIAVAEYKLEANDATGAEQLLTVYGPTLPVNEHSSYEAARLKKVQGDLAFARHNFSSAEHLYTTALTYTASGPAVWEQRARSRSILGLDDSAASDIKIAISLFSSGNPSSSDKAIAELIRGTIEEQRGKLDSSIASYGSALQTFSKALQNNILYTSERERLAFIRRLKQSSGRVFSTVFRNNIVRPELNDLAFEWMLLQKGVVLSSLSSAYSTARNANDTVLDRYLAELSDLRLRRTALGIKDSFKLAHPYYTRDSIDRDINEIEKLLVRRSNQFKRYASLGEQAESSLRASLAPGSCILDILTFPYYDGERKTDSTFYASIVSTGDTKRHASFAYIGLASALEDKAIIREYFRSLEHGTAKTKESALLISSLLWKPIDPYVDSFRTIYLSPDGVYNQISFAALPLDKKTDIIDKYRIVVLASVSDLLRDTATSAQTISFFADPDFGTAASGSASSQSTPKEKPIKPLVPLPGTREEAVSISSLFSKTGWKTALHLGDDATVRALRNIHRPAILHLATHGKFSEDSSETNALLHSRLFFSKANERSAAAPTLGVFSALEAQSLDLEGTDLVTLSSCESGRGTIEPGEGVFGLPRALRTAGARNVLMSLWKIPDTETAELMTEFYRQLLNGASKSDALQAAELYMRAVVKKRYNEDRPLYWAGFTLIGY